jgi:hypothetical protein
MTLTSFERRWARQIGRSLLPADALGGSTAGGDIGEEVAHHAAESPWFSTMVLRLGLLITWFAPLFVLGRPRTFGGLDEPDRVRCLERLLEARVFVFREIMMLTKLGFCSVMMGRESVMLYLAAYDYPKHAAEAAAAKAAAGASTTIRSAS